MGKVPASRKKKSSTKNSHQNREDNTTPLISNIVEGNNRLDSPERRVNISISTNERRGKIKIEKLRDSYNSPVKLQNSMEETFLDDRSGIESEE